MHMRMHMHMHMHMRCACHTHRGYTYYEQLKCNGTLEAVQLMRHGYPNRVPYDLMFDRYQKHLSGVSMSMHVHVHVPQ